MQWGCQCPVAATAWAGACQLRRLAQAADPIEVVVSRDPAEPLQSSGQIAAPALQAAAHLADFVQHSVLGDGAVHLQLIAGFPILLPLDDLLVVAVGDGRQTVERNRGEMIAAAQGGASVHKAGVEQHPARPLALLAARIRAVGEQIHAEQMGLGGQQPRLVQALFGQRNLFALVVRVQAVLLRADHPADEATILHAGGKLPSQDLPLVAQHVEVVDYGRLGFAKGGVAVAFKVEFEDIHGEASILLLFEQQGGQAIDLLLEAVELLAQLLQIDGLGRGGSGGGAGRGRVC